METKILCALQNVSLSFIFKTFPNVTLYVLAEYWDQKFSPRFHERLSLSFIFNTFPSVTLYVLGEYWDQNFLRTSNVSLSFIFKTFLQEPDANQARIRGQEPGARVQKGEGGGGGVRAARSHARALASTRARVLA